VRGPDFGEWLRRQREARAWARSEMARQLIKAASSNNDTSIPGVDSLTHSIYRWERGAVSLTERYKLYYCQAFGISPADFGSDREESKVYRFSVSGDLAKEVIGLLNDLRDVFCEWRETRAALEAQVHTKPPARVASGFGAGRAQARKPDPRRPVRKAG
jgi:hypothetical protein